MYNNSVIEMELINEDYWDKFYKDFKDEEGSPFCNYIQTKISKKAFVIDVGCGNGRDTFCFYNNGYFVEGLDRSTEAINSNNERVRKGSYEEFRIKFSKTDISKEDIFFEKLESIVNRVNGSFDKVMVYNRFLLHSIDEKTESAFLNVCSRVLKKGDLFVSEFRTIEDIQTEKVFENHYRRYIDSNALVEKLIKLYQFDIIEYTKGKGFSKYKSEDPYLARVIAKK